MTRKSIDVFLLRVALCIAFSGTFGTALADTFIRPVSQRVVACVFDDTNCAKAGWYHTAYDYGSAAGPNIMATACGVVTLKVINGQSDHGMGNCVIIKHTLVGGGTVYSLYAHMADIDGTVEVGNPIVTGQIIGHMGGTGYGETNHWPTHLHFEIKTANTTSNPTNGGPYWGYTPQPAENYGYLDPADYVNVAQAQCGNCAPASIHWAGFPTPDRWYRSDEQLNYHVDGTRPNTVEELLDDQTKASYDTSDGYLKLSYYSIGWHKYEARARNACNGDWSWTGGWYGGWDTNAPSAFRSSGVPPTTWESPGAVASWHCIDDASGVRQFHFRWNDGPWSDWTHASDGSASLPSGKNRLFVEVEDSTFTGSDEIGNRATVDLGEYWLDGNPPVANKPTVNTGSPTARDRITVALGGTDAESGVSRLEFYVDGFLNRVTTGTSSSITWITDSVAEGEHSLIAKCYDKSGNSSYSPETKIVIDRTPPTATLSAPIPTGSNGWYVLPTSVSLSFTDADPASKIYYATGPSFLPYTGAVGLSQSGVIPFRYYAVDRAGNTSAISAKTLYVDMSRPPTPILTDEGAITPNTSAINLTASIIDPESGLWFIEYQVGTTSGGSDLRAPKRFYTNQPYIAIEGLTIPNGKTVYVRARLFDRAGWASGYADSDGIRIDTSSNPYLMLTRVWPSTGGLVKHPDISVYNSLGETAIGFDWVFGIVTGILAPLIGIPLQPVAPQIREVQPRD